MSWNVSFKKKTFSSPHTPPPSLFWNNKTVWLCLAACKWFETTKRIAVQAYLPYDSNRNFVFILFQSLYFICFPYCFANCDIKSIGINEDYFYFLAKEYLPTKRNSFEWNTLFPPPQIDSRWAFFYPKAPYMELMELANKRRQR